MSNKTDFPYNEDNFVEQNGELKELTVTITLQEYRNLIEERCYSDKAIEQLQEEVEELRKQRDNYVKIYLSKNPEIAEKIEDIVMFISKDVAAGLFNDNDTDESEVADNDF